MRISKTLWQGVLLASVTCGSAAALAQDAVEAQAPTSETAESEALQAEANKAPARPFIERSLVIAPEQVGKFKLYSMNDYPGQPGAGIQVRYQHEDFPDVRVDLFVYPAGRVERAEALDSAMRDLRQSLEYAVEKGSYSNLEFGRDGEFDLRRVDSDGSLRAPEEKAAPDPDKPDLDAVLAAVSNKEDYRVGRLLEARLSMGDEAMESHGYLFYRGLYLVKGRISATALTLPGESFVRFTQLAMATLVPAVTTRSTGSCFKKEILVDPDAEDASENLAKQLVVSLARDKQEQCAEIMDETIPAGHRAMPLIYPAGSWGSKG
ncbi:MAG: hypothetical protein NT046_04505 [Arenimonas sp.]|nr:hypothetical protein [Arenimonas sp.]